MLAFVLFACSSGEPIPGPPPSTTEETAAAPTGDTSVPAPTSTPTGETGGLPPPPAFGELPRDEWSYVPVDGMRCANGSGTGIGIQPGTDPTTLLILVQGGGACWDFGTCLLVPPPTT